MRSLLLVYSTGMKSLLSPWLQNIYFSPFLWILVPFQWILVDSGGMAPFLQESVGQGEVLVPSADSDIGESNLVNAFFRL